jgi:hypothetical protein
MVFTSDNTGFPDFLESADFSKTFLDFSFKMVKNIAGLSINV